MAKNYYRQSDFTVKPVSTTFKKTRYSAAVGLVDSTALTI